MQSVSGERGIQWSINFEFALSQFNLEKDRKATASLPSMITTTASSYRSCDLQELNMVGKRNIVESWLEVLAWVLVRVLAGYIGILLQLDSLRSLDTVAL